jgi:hypothetical protein
MPDLRWNQIYRREWLFQKQHPHAGREFIEPIRKGLEVVVRKMAYCLLNFGHTKQMLKLAKG